MNENNQSTFFNEVLPFQLHTLNILMRRLLIDLLREYDLTPEQWQIIALTNELGPAVPMPMYSKVMVNDRHTISRTITLLEKKGWISKTKENNNRKTYNINLTKKGKKNFPNIRRLFLKQGKHLDQLTKKEQQVMLKLTKKLIGIFSNYKI